VTVCEICGKEIKADRFYCWSEKYQCIICKKCQKKEDEDDRD